MKLMLMIEVDVDDVDDVSDVDDVGDVGDGKEVGVVSMKWKVDFGSCSLGRNFESAFGKKIDWQR